MRHGGTYYLLPANPLRVAAEFASVGAEWIHIVDLDGAKPDAVELDWRLRGPDGTLRWMRSEARRLALRPAAAVDTGRHDADRLALEHRERHRAEVEHDVVGLVVKARFRAVDVADDGGRGRARRCLECPRRVRWHRRWD